MAKEPSRDLPGPLPALIRSLRLETAGSPAARP